MASDWDSERLNAEGLLRCLSEDYLEEETQRRGLLNRWPEAPCSEDAVSSSNAERCIPELFLRDNDEDILLSFVCRQSFRFLQTFVRRSVNQLRQAGEADQVVHDGKPEVVEALWRLSDQGVIEAIPGLVEKLERKALLSIYSIVSGKKVDTRNRAYVAKKIREIFNHVSPLETQTERMQDVVTIMRYPGSYKKVESGSIELAASSPVEAAHSALLQIDQLPLKGLHAMLETLRGGRPPCKIGQPKVGGNKDRLTSRIRKLGNRYLFNIGDDEELPKPLRKSLIVMSLSARYAFGNDGRLIDFLGPISMEKQSLHHKFLSALSDVNYVKKENLLLLYKDFNGGLDVSSKLNSNTLRNKITTNFLDCLLNSEIRPVPENMITAAEKLKGMMRQQFALNTKPSRVNEKKDLRESTQVELEAVLRVSCHLQQILYDLSEYSDEGVQPASESDRRFSMVDCSRRMGHDESPLENGQITQRSPEGEILQLPNGRVASSRSQDVVAALDYKSDDDVDAAVSKRIQIWSCHQTLNSFNEEGLERIDSQKNCQHEAVSPTEAKRLRDITRVGDEAAGVGYSLIGGALEEMSRLSGKNLIPAVRSYLRSGVKRTFQETGMEVQEDLCEQDQVSFILSLAQMDPRISSRTMDRVKRRLVR